MGNDMALVTGGAGFIGDHLVDQLVDEGMAVRLIDSLEPQLHRGFQRFRSPGAHYFEGSVHYREALGQVLDGGGAVVLEPRSAWAEGCGNCRAGSGRGLPPPWS
ncbi:MAG TPA: NAD-dependent epimerase/dehydratase family protein [Actinomycetota bacterium]|nr:NAD-dependent epimerase/dehydratase family protein [Actinomycetota bacterium]